MTTPSQGETVTLSEVDTERFGIRVARAQVGGKDLSKLLESCIAARINLLIGRCATKELRTAQQMEANGFLLMDTLVYYSFELRKRPVPESSSRAHIRKFIFDDKVQVGTVAARAFEGYHGHYHADARLDPKKCDEGYVSWAVRSCTSRQVATEVLVAEREKHLVGFLTLRLNNPKEVEGVLFAVTPEAQRTGVGGSLIVEGLKWCKDQRAEEMVISTQVTNVPVQRVWCRVGFEPAYSVYTFHKWF